LAQTAELVVVDQTGADAASERTAQVEAIAQKLNARLVTPDDAPESDWVLVNTFDGLELRSGGLTGPVRIGAQLPERRKVSRSDPLGRALGTGCRSVVDATAGIGTDALVMVQMGYDVTVIERVPLIATLLEDRLSRSGRVAASVPVHVGDARKILLELKLTPDAVFLDPMFPGRRRASALPRKELVALAELAAPVETDETVARELLDTALDVATNRVVVKRLPESPELKAGPSHSLGGKTVRYDVYLA